jgi:hypothetical protein
MASNLVAVWFKSMTPEVVEQLIHDKQKCYFCKKKFSSSFSRVSTCLQCGLIAHSFCMREWDIEHSKCPECK